MSVFIPLHRAWENWIPSNPYDTDSRVEDRHHSVSIPEVERSSAEETKRVHSDPGAKEGQS